MVADMAANMEVHMVADMEVDKVAAMVAFMLAGKVTKLGVSTQFGRRKKGTLFSSYCQIGYPSS